MDHTVISYSLVGLWAKPINRLPVLDKKFSLDLFGDHYNTEHGISNEGFQVILRDGKPPYPYVKINPLRIQFLHLSLDELIILVDKVIGELKNTAPSDFSFNIKAIGINTENEWLGLEENADEYLSKKYLNNSIDIEESNGFRVKTNSIQFQLISEKTGLYGIKLEPRANNKKGLYVNINDHREVDSEGFPKDKQIRELFDDSFTKLERDIFPKIL